VYVTKNLYETIFDLHPELTEEEVEANIQSTVHFWKVKALRLSVIDRGGKRRLAVCYAEAALWLLQPHPLSCHPRTSPRLGACIA